MHQATQRIITAAAGVVLAIGTPALAQDARERTVTVRQETRRGVVREVAQNRRFPVEQTDRKTQTLPIGASGSLELRNISGDISVTAGSGRDTSIEIVRTSHGATPDDAKLGLERVQVEVDRQGERATVTARYPEERRPPYSVSVAYTVTAPPGTRVSISSIAGDVTVKNIKGDVSAQVTSGEIIVSGAGQVSSLRTVSGDITLTDVSTDSTVSAGAISGDVLLQRVKARRIAADTTNGTVIARDVTCDSVQLKSLAGDVEFSGALVRNGRYELGAHSGDVTFMFSGDVGFELQVNSFSGSISAPPTGIDFRNVSTSRRSLRGTVGDGSAVVAITTFSGDVRLGKK